MGGQLPWDEGTRKGDDGLIRVRPTGRKGGRAGSDDGRLDEERRRGEVSGSGIILKDTYA